MKRTKGHDALISGLTLTLPNNKVESQQGCVKDITLRSLVLKSINYRNFAIAALGVSALSLSGCAGFKRALGNEKIVPDEFRVVTKAPLVIPPEFNLRPPKPGEARPLELRPDMQAKTAVFGVTAGVNASEGEKLLIAKMGANNADSKIREILDEEAANVAHKDYGFADKILNFGKTKSIPSNPLDATAEAEALKAEAKIINNATGGKEVTIKQNKPRGFKLPGL